MFWCTICELDYIAGNSRELDEVNPVLWLATGGLALIVLVKYWKVGKHLSKIHIVSTWISKDAT